MKKTLAAAQFFVAGSDACTAIHTRDVAYVFPRCNIHEAGPVTAFAVRARGNSCNVHPKPERYGADPSEQHLHEPGRADEPAKHVADEDRGNEHVEGDSDYAGLYTECEIPCRDLMPYRFWCNEIPRQRNAAQQGNNENAGNGNDDELEPADTRRDGIIRFLPMQASSAEDIEC